MIADPILPVIAIATGVLATVIWTVVFGRSLRALGEGTEHRKQFVLMAATAWLASIGALSSSLGYATQLGLIGWSVPLDAMTFVASVGRGALFMGGLIVLTHYRPPRKET